ncbi:MAG: GntR family transcriptional regulator [Hyphomicrobiaceae bacterium]
MAKREAGSGDFRQPRVEAGGDVHQRLYERILDGTLPPGTRLKEIELAKRFGLSRTPIREALRKLETQGLATHARNRGMVVAALEPQAVAELYAMREALEGTAAALAARQASDVEIDVLGELVEADRAHAADPAYMARSNRAFHAAIHAAARNRYLTKAIQALHEAMALLGPTTLASAARARQSLDEHAVIVAAIRARDSNGADDAARAHVRAAFAERLRLNARRMEEGDGEV